MEKKKGFSVKAVLIPTISLFVICIVVTALLAFTNALTADTISVQAQEKENQSRFLVLPDADSFEQAASGENIYYKGIDKDGKTVGYTFTTSAKGYGGSVSVMTGIDSENGSVSGVVILSQNETPGLGANAVKDTFTSRYKQPLDDNPFTVIKNGTAKQGEIEAITGATITSQAVTDAVNKAVEIYKTIE